MIPRIWNISSDRDIALQMAPEIGDSYPRLGPGKSVDWRGGGRPLFPQGHKEMAEPSAEINWILFADPSRGQGRIDYWRILDNPIAAWKWLQK